MKRNQELEFKRNEERFAFLKWTGAAFRNTLVVPPGSGICHQVRIEYGKASLGTCDTTPFLWGRFLPLHRMSSTSSDVLSCFSQVNLEHLSRVVFEDNGLLYPDTLVGADSHTTLINGLGVLGWGMAVLEMSQQLAVYRE